MNEDFSYQCRRRSIPRRPPAAWPTPDEAERLGAGSGGAGGETVYGSQNTYFQGHWVTSAGNIRLFAEDRTAAGTVLTQEDPFMGLIASDFSQKGRVCMRGCQGVRITSGPPKQPDADNEGIAGIDIQTGDEQYINIMRGLDPWNTNQRITLAPQGIVIHCGTGQIALDAAQEITLQVAGGTSSITLTTTGIVLKGPQISIN
jgi:hypothetical protein